MRRRKVMLCYFCYEPATTRWLVVPRHLRPRWFFVALYWLVGIRQPVCMTHLKKELDTTRHLRIDRSSIKEEED